MSNQKKFYTWHDKTLVLDPGYFAYYSPVPAWYNKPATLNHPFGMGVENEIENSVENDVEYVPDVIDVIIDESQVVTEPVEIILREPLIEARKEIKTHPIAYVALGFLAGIIVAKM